MLRCRSQDYRSTSSWRQPLRSCLKYLSLAQRSRVVPSNDKNYGYCVTNWYFWRILSFFNVKGYFWRNSSFKYPNPVFLHSPLHYNLYAVNLAAPVTARSRGVKTEGSFQCLCGCNLHRPHSSPLGSKVGSLFHTTYHGPPDHRVIQYLWQQNCIVHPKGYFGANTSLAHGSSTRQHKCVKFLPSLWDVASNLI